MGMQSEASLLPCRGTRLCTNGTCGIQCSSLYPTQCGATAEGESICANLNGDILNWCALSQALPPLCCGTSSVCFKDPGIADACASDAIGPAKFCLLRFSKGPCNA